MDQETAQQLITLNKQFYQSFAIDFSETRGRLQPGVKKVLTNFPEADLVLDLGCGNGVITREMARQGYDFRYLGTDFSSALLKEAKQRIPDSFNGSFQLLDITHPSWDLEVDHPSFDVILCFATLHHLPSRMLRLRVFQHVRSLLADHGTFIHSTWQFLKSDRLRKRILPWSVVNIPEEDIDEGDYLIDWRRGGVGVRYVHVYTENELSSLAEESGFTIKESFYSDGKERNLSLYQYWTPNPDQ